MCIGISFKLIKKTDWTICYFSFVFDMCFGNASKNSLYGVGWFVRSISMWSISKLTAPAGSLTAHTLTQSTAPSRLGGCPNSDELAELQSWSISARPRIKRRRRRRPSRPSKWRGSGVPDERDELHSCSVNARSRFDRYRCRRRLRADEDVFMVGIPSIVTYSIKWYSKHVTIQHTTYSDTLF